MKALKFSLNGKTAFFKKPDVNNYIYFTYGNIHKIALLGILGAVIGLGGYEKQNYYKNQYEKIKKSDKKNQLDDEIKYSITYPEFYYKLKDLKIAIVPKNDKGYINKKVQVFNNSIGYASKEEGGNLITKEQWLESPRWDIYILLNGQSYEKEIKERLSKRQAVYIPYLGKNDHLANINEVEIIDIEEEKKYEEINSLFLKNKFKLINDINAIFSMKELWKYEERLPVALEEITNQYVTEPMVFTNYFVEVNKEEKIFRYKDLNLYFF